MRDGHGGKKSPIKTMPLRDAGQSLSENIDKLLNEKALMWIIFAAFGIAIAAMEWWRWFLKLPPQPIVYTAFALLLCAVAAWRLLVLRSQIRNARLGLKGEKVVGQCLEQLRAKGYQVFHDIPGDGFNVDHVLVGSGGVFVIETKTRMMPRGRKSEVVYNGKTVKVDGHPPERDPIAQVLAASGFVRNLIKDATGKEVEIRPVVLFPGWYTRQPEGSDVWVLNDTAFPKWIAGQRAVLSDADVQQIAGAISMYVRTMSKAQER
jgi:hypothetical protein